MDNEQRYPRNDTNDMADPKYPKSKCRPSYPFQRCDEEEAKDEEEDNSRDEELSGSKTIPESPELIELDLKRSCGIIDNLRYSMNDTSHENNNFRNYPMVVRHDIVNRKSEGEGGLSKVRPKILARR